MLKKFSRTISVISIVMVMVITNLSVSVSAYAPPQFSPLSDTNSPWGIFIDTGYFSHGGILSGLDNTDWGVTFISQIYKNGGFSSFNAYAKITDRNLCEYYDYGAILDYAGDKGTDIFKSGWYNLCGGRVNYSVEARNYRMGYDQYIAGIAAGTSNPNYQNQ